MICNCGNVFQNLSGQCPKCDSNIHSKNFNMQYPYDIDVGHNGETIETASEKLDKYIDNIQKKGYRSMQIITGKSKIRESIKEDLEAFKSSGKILKYESVPYNDGSFLVFLY